MSFVQAFNRPMRVSDGKIKRAAVLLAEDLEFDPEVRAEAATLLIALLQQPGFSRHQEIFEATCGGSTLEEFVARHTPSLEELEPTL